VQRGFELVGETFSRAAAEFDPATAPPDVDVSPRWGTLTSSCCSPIGTR
jgi:hypothetical protein